MSLGLEAQIEQLELALGLERDTNKMLTKIIEKQEEEIRSLNDALCETLERAYTGD